MHDCTTPKPRWCQCDCKRKDARLPLNPPHINEPKEVKMNFFYDLWCGPVFLFFFFLRLCSAAPAPVSPAVWTLLAKPATQIQKEEEDRYRGEVKMPVRFFLWSCGEIKRPVHAVFLLPDSTFEQISRFSTNSAAQTLSRSEWCWMRLQGLQRFSYFSSSASPSSPASSVWLHKSSLPPAQDWKLYLLFLFFSLSLFKRLQITSSPKARFV